MLDLGPIRARAEKATQGPWHVPDTPLKGEWVNDESNCNLACLNDVVGFCADGKSRYLAHTRIFNADFIAHSREDIPALIAEIEQLRAQLKAAEERIERLTWWIPLKSGLTSCRHCGYFKERGHSPYCPAAEQGGE